MKKLHLRPPKKFDFADEANRLLPRICFYCVAEGPTEESYFNGIRNNKAELKIKNNVHIEVIEKEKGQETLSHPIQLVKACLMQMGCMDQDGNFIPEDKWDKFCRWDNFDAEIDRVCVIFDRDYRNLDESIEEIFALCGKYHIEIVISNPNFELWLLMHFPEIKQYPSEMLLENKKNLRYQLFADASKNKKYLEILVSKHAEGYSKGSKLNFEKFLPLIPTALEQAKLYSQDAEALVHELGTSVGKWLEEIKA